MKHLLFADDSIIFSKATITKAMIIHSLLHKYSMNSGQLVNFSKSAIFFTHNTPRALRDHIASFLQIERWVVRTNFWDFLLLSLDPKRKLLSHSKPKFRAKFWDGRRDCYHMQVKRFLSKLLLSLST